MSIGDLLIKDDSVKNFAVGGMSKNTNKRSPKASPINSKKHSFIEMQD